MTTQASPRETAENAKPTSQDQPQPPKPVSDSAKPDAKAQKSPKDLSPVKDSGKRKNVQTPQPKGKGASGKKGNKESASTAKSSNASGSGSGKAKHHKNQPQRQRNFYNPPQKVLRHLAQQSYYDNFYVNQGQFYTLKQKYKTQLCRHFLDTGSCPLDKYCQFAHGPDELRQAGDPLPKNFGKTALGAVHSNFKTVPCKYWKESGTCKFGDSCSFYHDQEESRKLIDPLPNLPEGVTLPPMPARLQRHRGRNHRGKFNTDGQDWAANQPGGFFVAQNGGNQGIVNNFLQLTNIADIAAIGGFNPNKYLSGPPPPQPVQFTAPQQVFEQAKAAESDAKEDNEATAAEELAMVEQPTAETDPAVIEAAH